MKGVRGDVGDREAGMVLGEGSDEVCTETVVIFTLQVRTKVIPVNSDHHTCNIKHVLKVFTSI